MSHTKLPVDCRGYGLLDVHTGKVFLFPYIIKSLNAKLKPFGFEVEVSLESVEELRALILLEVRFRNQKEDHP